MEKCREEFEKLPEIVEILSSGYYYFLESSNEYNSDVEGVSTDTIDLAWCLYQKQQKQIDELKKEKSLQEMELNQLAQANQQWRISNDNLREEIRKLNSSG